MSKRTRKEKIATSIKRSSPVAENISQSLRYTLPTKHMHKEKITVLSSEDMLSFKDMRKDIMSTVALAVVSIITLFALSRFLS